MLRSEGGVEDTLFNTTRREIETFLSARLQEDAVSDSCFLAWSPCRMSSPSVVHRLAQKVYNAVD